MLESPMIVEEKNEHSGTNQKMQWNQIARQYEATQPCYLSIS